MRRGLAAVAPVLAFLFLVAMLEAAHLGPDQQRRGELDPRALAYGASMLLATALAIGLVVGSVRRALVLVGVTWAGLCIVSIVKRRYLGAPLYPWDLLRVRELVGIWDELPEGLKAAGVAATLAVGVALVACVASFAQRGPSLGGRIGRAAAGAALLTVLALPFHAAARSWFPGAGNAVSVALGLRNVRWWPELNYHVNGFTAGFLMSLDVLQIPRPAATAFDLPADCDPSAPPPVQAIAAEGRAPDVVVLLLESFFDPTTLGIPLSRDPIPFMRTMMASSGAELHSTLWAHGTANAEFEILTGLSTAFLPPDSVVFFHYLHAPIVSLATEFRRVGYRAESIHPNAGWFYARTEAYRWLGFEHAWFRDDFIAPRDARSRLSDDRLFFAKLRERLTSDAAQPKFLWGVTLGTHGPYARKRMPSCDLVVGAADPAPGSPSAAELESLRIYGCLLERLDRRLEEFIRWLESRSVPTVLFAYGDHWPPLGPDVDPYRPTRTRGDVPEGPLVSATPLLLWSNTGGPLPRGYRGGFTFLGPAILRAADVAPRCQFAVVEPLHARVGVVRAGPTQPGADPSVTSALDRYWALTYRLLVEGRP